MDFSSKLLYSNKRGYIILIPVPKVIVHVYSVIFNPGVLKGLRSVFIVNRSCTMTCHEKGEKYIFQKGEGE